MSTFTATPSKILLIDSNVFFAKRLSDALKQEGLEVVHSTQSAYALTMVEWNMPTAILCATNMRELGAHDIPRILNIDLKTAHIPVIAIGEGGDQALMDAFRAGCADYVDRRLGPDHIASHVRAFLKSHEEGFQPTQMLGSSDTALSGTLSHLDLPGVVQMLSQSRQTGALHVNSSELDGIIFFDVGAISHSESGDLVGDEAVVDIVKRCNSVENGVYKFVPGASAATRTVLRSPTELLLGALREVDESANPLGGEF
jgi:CheY-like chemotaxis protein